MQSSRRELLHTAGLAAVAVGLAGCNGDSSTGNNSTSASTTTDNTTDAAADDESTGSESASVAPAVAAEWNAMRSRLDDAYALGVAGLDGEGSSVANRTFERFEGASGEYGAHEYLESTNTANYEGFESGIRDLRDSLAEGDTDGAADGWRSAHQHLREAQIAVVGETGANALGVLRFGAAVNNIELLAAADEPDAAGTVAARIKSWFEDTAAYDALESADGDAYEDLESAMEAAKSAAESDDLAGVRTATDDAVNAAVAGAAAIASDDLATAGHLAAYQAQTWDAATLGALGGPSTGYAHAAVLNSYRAQAYDAHWLAAQGATDTAGTMADDAFAHFEADNDGYHEALEDADGEAYEGFESGISSLSTAIGNGNSSGVDSAVATVDDNLVTGIESLAGATGATLLEASFFRARIADARERYRLGATDAAAGIVADVFERFEADEAGLHEAVEETDEETYESFESAIASLQTAMENGNDSAVETHAETVMDELLSYMTAAGSDAQVGAAEASYMAARGFDAAGLSALGDGSRAQAITQSALTYFEGGAGGFHEALEDADHETYESFEGNLSAVGSAAESGNAYGAAKTFYSDAIAAAYAVVNTAGGSFVSPAATMVDDVLESFESNDGDTHETLEDADHATYENFESQLDALSVALSESGDVRGAASRSANATLRAQFAVAGAVEKSPVSESGESTAEETTYEGGPNVQQGVPSDADHVIDMNLVAFDPKELTIEKGDTVAWKHNKGEPHSVTAYEGEIPSDADYWASGGFDSESAAREGWNEDSGTVKGAITSGQSYVYTFETTGTHEYVCLPHENMGMTGTIVVEE